MPCKQACHHTATMVLHYFIIQMAETSASGLGGDTETASRSSCQVLDLDLGNLPFEHQAPIVLCDDHILIRTLQDPRLNRSSSRRSRIARIQTAVPGLVRRALAGGSAMQGQAHRGSGAHQVPRCGLRVQCRAQFRVRRSPHGGRGTGPHARCRLRSIKSRPEFYYTHASTFHWIIFLP